MNREIFISYSRWNLDEVKAIKEKIEQETYASCWMDLNAIESGATQFTQDIVDGIKTCPVFLFMLSAKSQESEFALRELNFAMKKARSNKQRHVVIVNIDNCEMCDEFDLMYGLTDTIMWQDKPQQEKLLKDLMRWTKKAEKVAKRKAEEEAKRKVEEEAKRKAEEEEAKRKAAEEEAKRKAEEEKRKAIAAAATSKPDPMLSNTKQSEHVESNSNNEAEDPLPTYTNSNWKLPFKIGGIGFAALVGFIGLVFWIIVYIAAVKSCSRYNFNNTNNTVFVDSTAVVDTTSIDTIACD